MTEWHMPGGRLQVNSQKLLVIALTLTQLQRLSKLLILRTHQNNIHISTDFFPSNGGEREN